MNTLKASEANDHELGLDYEIVCADQETADKGFRIYTKPGYDSVIIPIDSEEPSTLDGDGIITFHNFSVIRHKESGISWIEGSSGSAKTIIKLDADTQEILYSQVTARNFELLQGTSDSTPLFLAKNGKKESLVSMDSLKEKNIIITDIPEEYSELGIEYVGGGKFSSTDDDAIISGFQNIKSLGSNEFSGKIEVSYFGSVNGGEIDITFTTHGDNLDENQYSSYSADEIFNQMGFNIVHVDNSNVKIVAQKSLEGTYDNTDGGDDQTSDLIVDGQIDISDYSFQKLKLVKHNDSGVFWFEGEAGANTRLIQVDLITKKLFISEKSYRSFEFLKISDAGIPLIIAVGPSGQGCLLNPDTGKPYKIYDETRGEIKEPLKNIKYKGGNRFSGCGNYDMTYEFTIRELDSLNNEMIGLDSPEEVTTYVENTINKIL